jgi:glutathione synthase/RimK-type ligase-like ATP-grasp enzyme
MHFLLVCNPENRRAGAFMAEIEALKTHSSTVVSYQDLLDNSVDLRAHIRPNTVVKIESPGENDAVRRGLIEYGAGRSFVPNPAFLADFGRICYQDEWYRGFCAFLSDLKARLRPFKAPLMNDIDSIVAMFDKVETKRILAQNNVPTPPALGPFSDYAALRDAMQTRRIHSVFIKPAHGSSASGVVAFRTNSKQVQAISSIRLAEAHGGFALYNSLKVRTYRDESSIVPLINSILAGKTSVEQWIPKAAFNGALFDFRVVVIAGKARHVVARASRSPITNLHLGNARGDLPAIAAHIGAARLEAVKNAAEQTAACFPDCLYMGVDVLLSANLKQVMVLEVNAFGDLLPHLTDAGESVYEAQIKASIQRWSK